MLFETAGRHVVAVVLAVVVNQQPLKSILAKHSKKKSFPQSHHRLEIRNRCRLDKLGCQDRLGLRFKRKTRGCHEIDNEII